MRTSLATNNSVPTNVNYAPTVPTDLDWEVYLCPSWLGAGSFSDDGRAAGSYCGECDNSARVVWIMCGLYVQISDSNSEANSEGT